MTNFTFVALVVATLFTGLARAQDGVTAGGTVNTDYQRLSIEHRHWKAFKCWGGPDNHRSSNSSGSAAGSGANGSAATSDHGFGYPYQGHSASWDAKFVNQEFEVNFQHNVSLPSRTEHHSDCSTDENFLKVTNATSDLFAQVDIQIPPNVWFVQIKATQIDPSVADASSTISGNSSLRSVDEISVGENLYAPKTSRFYSTRPGDKIALAVKWKVTETRSRTLSTKFKVTFVGRDQCQDFHKDLKSYHASLVSEALNKSGNQPDDQLIYSVGCLMNDEYGLRILRANDTTSVLALLETLQSIGLSANPSVQANNNLKALGLVSLFTQYKLTYMALSDVAQLCRKTQITDLYTEKDGVEANGFYANYYYLTRMLQKLEAYDYQRFGVFIGAIKDISQKFPTYKLLTADPKRKEVVARAYEVLRSSVSPVPGSNFLDTLPFRSTLLLFNKMQLTQMDADSFTAMQTHLQQLASMQYEFTKAIDSISYPLAKGVDTAIDFSNLENLLDQMGRTTTSLIRFFLNKKQWFSATPSDSPFVRDMTAYLVELRRFSEGMADPTLVKHRTDFLNTYSPNLLRQEVESCLAPLN
ncbi:MAG: hypothetical protein IT289_07725 [Oligoflexia bacterium]|nr:hypothetical protein [Oligoflexia bacterium]